MKTSTYSSGFIVLLSAIIILGITSVLVLLLLRTGVSASHDGIWYIDSMRAREYAQGCVDGAQYRFRTDTQITQYSAVFGDGSCSADIVVSPQDIHITATGVVGSIQRNILVTATVTPDFVILDWVE